MMSQNGRWFLVERDMMEKWPALFKIDYKIEKGAI